MAALIGQLVALVLVREDQSSRHGVQPQGVVKLPQCRPHGLRKRGEMGLIQHCLHELSRQRDSRKPTHVSLHIGHLLAALDSNQVSQNATHQIFAADDNLLAKVSETARVRDKSGVGDAGQETLGEYWRKSRAGERRGRPWVQGTRDEDKVRLVQQGQGQEQVCQSIETVCGMSASESIVPSQSSLVYAFRPPSPSQPRWQKSPQNTNTMGRYSAASA